MTDPAPAHPRALLSRLEFRIRNLEAKRKGLCGRIGRALFERGPTTPPQRRVAKDFEAARQGLAAVAALEAEDVALAADSAGTSRGARLAHSLAQVTGKGRDYARSVQVESRQKKLLRERAECLARLGRALSAKREEVHDERIDRMLAQADLLEAELAGRDVEARTLQEQSASMDPALRKRVYWIAAGIGVLLLALCWWIALSVVF